MHSIGDVMVSIFAPFFAVLVGVAMIGQWMRSYLTGQIPELEQEPIRIYFHLVAESITAMCLISGGFGLWLNSSWGKSLYLIAMGMLFYTAIVSPGYFAQQGDWKWLGIFSSLIVMGLVSVFLIV
jgi:hypothetical protein